MNHQSRMDRQLMLDLERLINEIVDTALYNADCDLSDITDDIEGSRLFTLTEGVYRLKALALDDEVESPIERMRRQVG